MTDTFIHPQAIVEKGAELDQGVYVGPFCWVGAKVKIASGTNLKSHVRLESITEIGHNNQIDSFVSIGGAPQDLTFKGEESKVVIGDNNTFRECFTAHRATTKGDGVTIIGSHNLFMTYTHVAHDCIVGDHTIIGNYSGFSGHVVVEDYANISGQSAVIQFGRVGRYSFMAGGCMMRRDMAPFMSAKDDGKITGPNIVGLKRNGFTPAQLRTVKELYKIYYNKKKTVKFALVEIKERFAEDAVAKEFVDFVESSKIGVKR